MKKEYLSRFNISGFTYYDGVLVFRKLKVGKKLTLKLEENNKHDPKAVAIYFKNVKIGYIPRNENRVFYKLIKVGLRNNIQVRVQNMDPTVYPEEQVYAVAHLINKKTK